MLCKRVYPRGRKPFSPGFYNEPSLVPTVLARARQLPVGSVIGIDGHLGTYKSEFAEWLADSIDGVAIDHDFFYEKQADGCNKFRPDWWRDTVMYFSKDSIVVASGICMLRSFERTELDIYVYISSSVRGALAPRLSTYIGGYFEERELDYDEEFRATAADHLPTD